MKIDRRLFIIFIMALVFIPGAYAGSISIGGGTSISGTGSGQGNFASNGGLTTGSAVLKDVSIIADHWVQWIGLYAEVSVNVPDADSGTYQYKLSPSFQTTIEAQEWLDVTNAKTSIQAKAKASNGEGDQADVGIIMGPGSLVGYTNSAIATSSPFTQVTAQQSATMGSGNSITISGSAIDRSGTYSVNTPLSGSFTGLSASSFAGITTQVSQAEQVMGMFSSTATAPGGKTKTRTSNFGVKYDLNMQAAKGGSPTGILGYYVDPSMATSTLGAIQGAINAAQSKDTINAAAGTYKENVNIDRSLAVKGAGQGITIVNGNQANSVFTINPNVAATLYGMTITNGAASDGGGIYNQGTLNLYNVLITGNTASFDGGGIDNEWGTVNMYTGSSITGNIASDGAGGGIENDGGTVNMYTGSSITGNTAGWIGSGGGIGNYGGTVNLNGGSITGNTAGIGGGIDNYEGTVNLNSGSITGNTALRGHGGGIDNDGHYSYGTVNGDKSLVHDNSPNNIESYDQ